MPPLQCICIEDSASEMILSSLELQNTPIVDKFPCMIQFLFTLEFYCSQSTATMTNVN